MSLLEVTGLDKTFHTRSTSLWRTKRSPYHAVDDVSLTIERGETYSLVGESGAGKSTVGRLILRLVTPDAGSVRLNGTELTSLSDADMRLQRRAMQVVFQNPYGSFNPRHTIGDAIIEPLDYYEIGSASDRRKRVLELAERVGIGAHLLTKYPGHLSGGELQRAAIARVLTVDPELIICDEIVSALDVSIRALVINLMKDLQADLGISYLFIAHDLALVEAISDRVGVMQHGRMVEQGTTADIFERPTQEYTRALLAAIPTGHQRSDVPPTSPAPRATPAERVSAR